MIGATNQDGGLRGVAAVGASAGGVEALSRSARGLSPDLPYALLIVLHVPAGAPSVLARIVDRSGPLPAVAAEDGALGLAAIRSRGGTTIGQSPEDALFPALHTNARNAGVLDRLAATADLGALLKELSQRGVEDPITAPDAALDLENRIPMTSRFSPEFDTHELGVPSGCTCPDCNGSLISLGEGNFRCRVGHAWTSDALLAARNREIEGALWVALRSLQEKAKLARQVAEKAGPGPIADRYRTLAEESERALSVLSDRLAANAPDRDDAGG